MTVWPRPALSIALLLTACTSYPPPLAPARGQTAWPKAVARIAREGEDNWRPEPL